MYLNLTLFFLFATQVACNKTIAYNATYRELFTKKLRTIAKVVKTGIKIAAIANPAGLKALALAKAKEFAIKKGLQCLKNGLSNFCNGKKKLGKFSSISKVKGLVKNGLSKAKAKVNDRVSKAKGRISKAKGRLSKAKGRIPKAKSKVSKVKDRISKAKSKVKGRISKAKSKIKDRVSKAKGRLSKIKDRLNKLNCNNVFDNIAKRINNATNRIIENPVNKGRDWLKKNIGGNTNCPKSSRKPVKKHLLPPLLRRCRARRLDVRHGKL